MQWTCLPQLVRPNPQPKCFQSCLASMHGAAPEIARHHEHLVFQTSPRNRKPSRLGVEWQSKVTLAVKVYSLQQQTQVQDGTFSSCWWNSLPPLWSEPSPRTWGNTLNAHLGRKVRLQLPKYGVAPEIDLAEALFKFCIRIVQKFAVKGQV